MECQEEVRKCYFYMITELNIHGMDHSNDWNIQILIEQSNIPRLNLDSIILAQMIDSEKLYNELLNRGVVVSNKHVKYAIDKDNIKWYTIYQRSKIYDETSSLNHAIMKESVSITAYCIKMNYKIYLTHIMNAFESSSITSSLVIEELIELYVTQNNSSYDNLVVFTPIIIKSRNLKLTKKYIDKMNFNLSINDIKKCCENKDYIYLEFMLVNFTRNCDLYSIESSTLNNDEFILPLLKMNNIKVR